MVVRAVIIIFTGNNMIQTQVVKKIIETRNEINSLEVELNTALQEFKESMKPKSTKLEKLKQQKDVLEKDLIKKMKDSNIPSLKIDDNNIICSKRITIKLEDEVVLRDYILNNASNLKQYVKDSITTKDELIEKIMPRKLTISSAKFLLDRFHDITGDILPGTVLDEIHFLTVKSINNENQTI